VTQAHQRPRHLYAAVSCSAAVRAARERHRIGPLAVQNPRGLFERARRAEFERGSRIMARVPSLSPGEIFAGGSIVHRVAISTFPRRRNAQSLGPIDMRKWLGP